VSDSPVWPSEGAEAFRLLYSSLTYGWGDRQRTILVTSVAPQEGKTLVAANLGVTFAREGARVLLIDCDLRRPSLHKLFQVSRAPGLAELYLPASSTAERELAEAENSRRPPEHGHSMLPEVVRPGESATAEPAGHSKAATNGNGRTQAAAPQVGDHRSACFRNIRETGTRGLWLLPCGAVEGNSPGTLRAGTIRNLLNALASDFDVILLDTAPALLSAEAVVLAPIADDVLLVVRAGYTDRHAAERVHQQLSDAGGHLVGAVLNDPDGKVTRDHQQYAYGYPATSD
jgi:Mrp family chromosome partitioning ATPase